MRDDQSILQLSEDSCIALHIVACNHLIILQSKIIERIKLLPNLRWRNWERKRLHSNLVHGTNRVEREFNVMYDIRVSKLWQPSFNNYVIS